MLTLGSLFTGYGGLDMAVEEVFGARTVWVSDNYPGACKVIERRFPEVPNLGDITKIDWSEVDPVDILAGGTPCQDLSTAGRRAGMTEGTRSNLWVQMREGINELRPRFVVWENVRGAYSAGADSAMGRSQRRLEGSSVPPEGPSLRALGRVLGDLASLGYDSQWCGLRASDVGAPHQRHRIFLLATDRRAQKGVRTEGVQVPGAPTPPVLSGGNVDRAFHWKHYTPAIRRWERVTGIPAPLPLDDRGRLSTAFSEWMMGIPAGWVTDVSELTRTESLQITANGVVPQQAVAALTQLLKVSARYP